METIDTMLTQAINGTFCETTYDETKISALENRLSQYLAASELSVRNIASEREKIKALIADISHQTKTPLANILLYTELLEEESLSSGAEESVARLRFQADKLQFLITSLVKLSRLETGIISLHVKYENLSEMVQRTVDSYREKIKEKGLLLEEQYVDANAFFDAKWSAEAIGNLLDNAVKYTNHGKISITIREYELFACVEIADTGIGIPEEEQAKVFTRFYRCAEVAKEEGVGIGLYLTREILSQENGYLKLTSTWKKGSVFSVYFPKINKQKIKINNK